MALSKEQIEARMRNAQGIPANPEIQAAIAQDQLQQEQPATPPGLEPASPEEQGLDPNAAAADFFGGLAAEMDGETASTPYVHAEQPRGPVAPVEELPYEPPVHLRQPGEVPESLQPQAPETTPPLEAAIEQPIAEEELRMTAEQWAAAHAATQQPQTQPPPQPEPPPLDPAQLEANAISHLMETEYALSDEDKNALISEPDTVIPKLAARMHVRMQVQMAQQLSQVLPQMISQQINQASKVQRLESQFFSEYPALNKPEFRQTVAESLAMVRQFNPNAKREDVMRDGAALAAVRLKTQLDPAQQPSPRQPLPLQGPAQVTRQQPFTPAQSGGGTEPVVPNQQSSQNIFETLAFDDDW